VEFLTATKVLLSVKQHVSMTAPALPLTGSQATLRNHVGFWRQM